MAAFVQIGIGAGNGTTATTGTGGTGFGSATTGGNSLVVGVSWGSGTVAITSVTDSKSNTYTQAGSTVVGYSRSLAIFYCLAPTMGSSHTVTMTIASSSFDLQILAHEVSEITSFDAIVTDNAEAGTAVDTPAMTPASNGAYLFGHARCCNSTQNLAPNTGTIAWTERGSVNFGTDSESQTQDFVQVTAASLTCEWTASSTGNVICAMAGFLASGGGGVVGPLLAGHLTSGGILAGRLVGH